LKSLIVTTGKEEIFNTYLPSLRQNGKFYGIDGDILILGYGDFSAESLEYFKTQSTIIYRETSKVYDCYASDRMRGFYEALTPFWSRYDSIVITDSDIEFFKPIKPLLEMAKKGLCAVKEPTFNRFLTQSAPQHIKEKFKDATAKLPSNYWASIKDELIFNAGVIAGTPSEIKALLEFMIKYMEENGSSFGTEQFCLNIWTYFFKHPIHDVGYSWNALNHFGFLECFSEVSGSLHHYQNFHPVYRLSFGKRLSVKLTPFDGTKEISVAILHMHEEEKNRFFLNNDSIEYSQNPCFSGGKKSVMTKKLTKLFEADFSDFDLPIEVKRKLKNALS
jgi:hypothetical protein